MSVSTADISVIIPCLNAEATLGEAIESLFKQTAPPREVLLIDDRSTDDSVRVARSFGPRVRTFRNPGRGPGAARQLGVMEARGEYIAYVDADDYVEPTKHERQLNVLDNRDRYTLVHTGSMLYWPDGLKETYQRTGAERATGRCTQVVFERNPVCGASTMLRRSVILELGNYDAELFGTEDFGMSLIASTYCGFVYIPEPLYWMRQHTTNITRRAAHMAYHHWLAQEKFRLRCPSAFAALSHESVQQYMIDPVVRTVKQCYWRREEKDYRRLLELALRIAPDDHELIRLWRRRWVPMRWLKKFDQLQKSYKAPVPEVT